MQQPSRRIPLGIAAGFSALVLTTGSAVAWWAWTSRPPVPATVQSSPQSSPAPQERQAPPIVASPNSVQKPESKTTPAPTERTLQVYWLKGSGSSVELLPRPVKLSTTDNPNAVLETALNQLLAGPSDAATSTTIPRGTTLNSVALKPDGIHVDMSKAFTSGGGSASMTARVAQVLYTVTSLNPSARVWLFVEGEPLETLGGEGLMLDQPISRESFEKEFAL